MKQSFFQGYIFLVLFASECLSKSVPTGAAVLSRKGNIDLAKAVEYFKRFGYLVERKTSFSERNSGISMVNNNKKFVQLSSFPSFHTTGKTDCFEDARAPQCLLNVMAYTEKEIAKAINKFQEIHGVTNTGILDKITRETMEAPRCGMTDHVGISPVKTLLRGKRFSTEGNKRPRRALSKKGSVTYNIVSSSKRLTQTEVRVTIKKALRKWAEVIPIVFRKSSSTADIRITFAEGNHSCSIKPTFDGKGQVLGHVRYSTPQFAGEIHFNDAANWSTDAGTPTAKISLIRTAMHMGGHMLGLQGHSSVPNSIMNAEYPSDAVVKTELGDDDIQRVQQIYGLCETSFDAIESWMGNGKTYTFKTDQYWRFNDVKRRTEPNYPQPTTLWRGIPQDIDEMLLWGHNWATYFFKGDKYYKYKDTADAVQHISYISQGWSGVPDNIDAAFTHSDLKTYFFKGNLVYQFDNIADRVSTGYPKNISAVFPGVPNYLDTAFRWYHDGKSYFFKGFYFYEWSHTSNTAVGPQKIAQKWQNHCFV